MAEMCIISASKQVSTLTRAEHLGVGHVRIGAENKLEALNEIRAKLGIELSQIAHVGDDLTDVSLMKHIGLAITIADGVDEAIEIAEFVTEKAGGKGAVRELCDIIVQSRND